MTNSMSDELTVFFPRKLVKQFILKYKEHECLWNRECPTYKVKKRRHSAITDLTELVQKYDPAATRVHVLRKIDSLRACVRREYRKVIDSRRIATCDEDIYEPQLWYYQLFAFLIRHDEQEAGIKVKDAPPVEPDLDSSEDDVEDTSNRIDVKSEATSEAADCEEYEHVTAEPSHQNTPPPPRKRSRPRGSEGASMEDEYDAIGMNVAAKLRNLPENMRILAEKLIGDVLFQAQTNGLTTASVLVTPDPFH